MTARSGGAVRATASSPAFLSTVLVAFLLMLGFSLVGPLVPTVVAEFGVSRAGAGLLLSSFALGRLTFTLAAGVLGDRYGIRPVAVFACLLTVVAALVAALTPVYGWVLVARVLQGAGSALYMTVSMAYVLQIAPAGHVGKLLSLHQGSILLAITAGPALGGATAEAGGLTGTFLLYGGLALLGVVPSLLWLPGRATPRVVAAPARSGEPDDRSAAIRRLLRGRTFLLALMGSFTLFLVRAGVGNTVTPLFAAERFGFDEAAVGWVLTSAAFGNLLVLWHAGSSVDRVGRRPIMIASTFLLVIVLAGFSMAPNAASLFVLSLVLGMVMGYGSVVPNAVLADVVEPSVRGTGVGVLRTTTDLGMLVGPVLAGASTDWLGHEGSFVLSALIVSAVAVAVCFMRETRPGTVVDVVDQQDQRRD